MEAAMAAAPRPAARRYQRRCDEIVRAAVELFAANGYQETTLAVIADAVDLTPSALYRYFPTKQALLEQCLREGARRGQPGWSDAARQPTGHSLFEDVRDWSRLELSHLINCARTIRVMVAEGLRGNACAREVYRELRLRSELELQHMLDQHSEAAASEPRDRAQLARAVTTMLFGLLFEYLGTEKPLPDAGPVAPHGIETYLDRMIEPLTRGWEGNRLPGSRARTLH
jgi:AcrR family transcriptional regulator